MKLLSKELVSHEYCDQLQRDLARAKVCRFLVGYVSSEGVNAIRRFLLLAALRDEQKNAICAEQVIVVRSLPGSGIGSSPVFHGGQAGSLSHGLMNNPP